MSSFSRRLAVLLLLAVPVAGCGFTPVHAPGASGDLLRNRVLVEAPDTRLEFQFVARMEERIGRTDAADFTLDYTLSTASRGLAITGADDVTRVNIAGDLTYVLSNALTGETVTRGTVSTFSAYSTTGSPVATNAARRDAEDRLMIGLADQVVSRLLASVGTAQ